MRLTGPRPSLATATRLVTLPLALTMALALAPPGAAGAAGAAADSGGFTDRLGTLALDRELPSRGRLGGVAVDRLGYLYVANFHDRLWRIDPDGRVETLAQGLYGSSGVAVDSRGDVLQANFFGNTLVRIDRRGGVELVASSGLSGPVGIALDADDTATVCNCSGNSLVRVSREGAVEPFAESELFACPNGITYGEDGELFVTNFNSLDVLRVTPRGEVTRFVTVPGGAGNAHIAFAKGFFYVTKIIAHQVFKISERGEITLVAGSGQPGHDDGDALAGTLHRPNGIAAAPTGDLLYVNTLVGNYNSGERTRISVRTLELTTLTKVLRAAETDGVEAMRDAYRRYKEDAVRGAENTVAETITYGYSLLSNRRIAEALAIFELNASSYPAVAVAQYHLGEAYRYTGRTEQAIKQYQRALALDPEHALSKSRLAQLEAGG